MGGIFGDLVGQIIGVGQTIGVMTALGSLPFLWVYLSPVRKLRQIPRPSDLSLARELGFPLLEESLHTFDVVPRLPRYLLQICLVLQCRIHINNNRPVESTLR